MMQTRKSLSIATVALLALLAVYGASLGAFAQDDTPTPAPGVSTGMVAAIHQGSCQQPDQMAAHDLGTFGVPTDENGQPIQSQGIMTGPPLLQAAASDLPFNLNDTLNSGTPYVIIVHQSAEQFGTYLACGELAGPIVNNELAVALRPVNNTGFAGVATLTADGDTTSSTVYLIQELLALSGGQMTGTPPPQPTPVAAQGTFPPTQPPTPPPTPTQAPPVEVTTTPEVIEVTTTPTVIQVTPTPA